MDKIITVVIPTYNRVDLTNRAVESVRSITPKIVEIVVVDDGGKIVYQYGAEENHSGISVRVLRSEVNGGPGMARKLGIADAHGKFVAFLDSDDVYDASWMDVVLSRLLEPDAATVNAEMFCGKVINGTVTQAACYEFLLSTPALLQGVVCKIILIFLNPFYTPSVIISRNICKINPTLRYCEDYYMNTLSAFRAKSVILLDSCACVLSRSPGTAGGESANSFKMFKGEMQVRWSLLSSREVPLVYRALVPLGVLYQIIRTAIKVLLKRTSSRHRGLV